MGTPQLAGGATAQAQIAWNATPGEQDGFKIEQSTDGVTFTSYGTVPDGTTNATITGLPHGKTFYFRVKAYNQAGESPYSPTLLVNTP